MIRPALALVVATLLVGAPLAPAAQSAQKWDEAFRAIPDATNIGDYMKRMSARPHHLGSPFGKETAEWILARFKGWGWEARIETYQVLFPTPKERLLEMVETVRAGDPFVAANAQRLQTIAWLLLALQLLSIVIGAIAKSISTAAHPVHLDAGFSVNSWLAVLLTFLLARVFAEGTRMREDLAGTV